MNGPFKLASPRVALPSPPFPSHSPHNMTTNIFIRDGIQIRRLDSGCFVLEDEWRQFVELNEVLTLFRAF